MLIKAITLWQPWASFMALGLKRNETRSWATRYRGPLAIHAAAKIPQKGEIPLDVLSFAVRELGHWRYWPLGKILCVIKLWDIDKNPMSPADPIEAMLGHYGVGRYAWKTQMLQVFDEPIPAKGKQGLWDWEWPEALKVRQLP